MKQVNPRVDIAFKKIFGVEENKDLLISLVNSIVSDADQVSDLTLLNPYNPQNFRNDKLSILDIKARGLDGKMFNIEIQISDEADYDKRALYYWAKLYTEQLKRASNYSELSKAIGIHILNFVSIPKAKKYHNVFRITEQDDGFEFFKDLELHTIELKKFTDSDSIKESLQDIAAKVKSSLDVWLAFLTRHDLLYADSLPQQLDNHNIKKALNIIEIMNFSVEENQAYEDHLKWLWIEENTIKKAEEKGAVRGRAEGREQGRAEGEIAAKIAMCKNLFAAGMAVDLVAKCSGLSIAEIAKLKREEACVPN